MLDGQGVTAEVVEPDIGATNGVIHVIDRILGILDTICNLFF